MPETTVPPASEVSAGKPVAFLLAGGAVVVVAVAAMAGWLLQEPRLIFSLHGRILLNSALCFALAGTVLLVNPLRPTLRNPLRATLGAVVALVSLVTLLQHFTDWNSGIDWADLRANLGETDLHPGRMPLVTSLIFLLYAGCCALMVRADTATGYAVRGLLALIVVAGLLTMAGHALGLDTMFDTNRFRLMSAPAAVGFVLIGVGSWLAWNSGRAVAVSEDNRIVLAGAIVVLVFGMVIGLAGLIALKNYTAQSLGDGLVLTAQGRANLIDTVLQDSISDIQDLGDRPELARLGGDEYAVVLESLAGREDGRRIAEKIVHAMRPAFTLQSRSLEITSSVGVAFYSGESELGPDGLVKHADDALYRAKHAGRNYQVYDEKADSERKKEEGKSA